MLSYEKESRDLGRIQLVGGESLVSLPVRFSKDNRYFFSCGGNKVYVFSSETASLVRELKGHTGEVTGYCLHNNNEFQLISCSIYGEIIFWDYTDSAILKKLNIGIQLFGVYTNCYHDNTLFVVRRSYKGKHFKQKLALLDLNDAESSQQTDLENLFVFNGHPWNCCFGEKGLYIAYVKNRELGLWNNKSKESKSFTYKDSMFTTVAFHPSELCVAAGDSVGKIIIWQNLLAKRPVTMEVHWHAHAARSLSFSYDGSCVISGGEEAVLVLWQYGTNTKQFLPRLGAPVSHISHTDDDKIIAVSLQDNVIKLISGLDLKLKNIVQGLRKARFMCKKLVFDPRTGSLVMNSSPGVLQFYNPYTDKGLFVVDVVKQNIISMTDSEKLYFTEVHFVCFSDDGSWMATIEYRNDHYTSDETRLKFWEFNSSTQCYSINTVIEMPHDRPTVALSFQPTTSHQPLAVSAGKDGKFKIWVLQDHRTVEEKKQTWVCQSVGYYSDAPCIDAVFSEDGGLLAVAYSNLITLWTPESNVLQKTLHLPFPDVSIRHVNFACKESSHYLVVSTNEFLIVWDLLSCSICWTIEACVAYLLPDPNSRYVAAFIVFDKKTHLYIFDPSTPSPVAVQSHVSRKDPIFTAAFDPKVTVSLQHNNKTLKMSKLYFLSKAQELFTLSTEFDDNKAVVTHETKTSTEETSADFLRVFGQPTKTAGESTANQATKKTLHGQPSSAVVREMLAIPSHVLPPVSSLCSTFLKSLLVSKEKNSSQDLTDVSESMDDSDVNKDDSDSDSETANQRLRKTPIAYKPEGKHTGDNADELDDLRLNRTDYSWLKESLNAL